MEEVVHQLKEVVLTSVRAQKASVELTAESLSFLKVNPCLRFYFSHIVTAKYEKRIDPALL